MSYRVFEDSNISAAARSRGEQALFDAAPVTVRQTPFEHVVVENFLAREIYDELVRTFPECPPCTGPTGYSLYWGDPVYEDLITNNAAWRALFEATHSDQFVAFCVSTFGPAARRAGCTLDLERVGYVSYRESREDKERRNILAPEHAPHELWVRTDIHQGQAGYFRNRHVDHRRRFASMLIYLCDACENRMQGGDLVLHHGYARPWWRLGARRRDVVVRARHNLMVAFPCHARSIHSVTPIVAQSAPRNFLQLTVSSSVDVWPS